MDTQNTEYSGHINSDQCEHPPESIVFIELISHPSLPAPQNTYQCNKCGVVEGDGMTEDEVVERLLTLAQRDDNASA